jgi:hypothetical protein
MGVFFESTNLQFAKKWNTQHFTGSPEVKSGSRLQSVFFASCLESVPAQGKTGAAVVFNRLRSSLQSVPAQGKNGTFLPAVQESHTRAARALSAEHQTQNQDTGFSNTSSSIRLVSSMPKTSYGSNCKPRADCVSNTKSGVTESVPV